MGTSLNNQIALHWHLIWQIVLLNYLRMSPSRMFDLKYMCFVGVKDYLTEPNFEYYIQSILPLVNILSFSTCKNLYESRFVPQKLKESLEFRLSQKDKNAF